MFSGSPHPNAPGAAQRDPTRWRLLLGATGVMMLLASVLLAGCSNPQQRYKVLSFFFDGVPPPEGYSPEQPPNVPGDLAFNPESDAAEPVIYTYHAPYVQRQCFSCHDQQQGYEIQQQNVQSCKECHQAYFELAPHDWMHGPVAMQQCKMCHEAHRSPHDGLLTAPQKELCFRCHDEPWFARDPFHSRVQDQRCSECHDPHAAGNRVLLVDARSFARRQKVQRSTGSAHPEWKRSQCTDCHVSEQSNLLNENVENACASCHEKATAPGGPGTELAPLHKAVADGKCLTCHTAHRSPRPNLLRPTAERACFTCHKREEIQTLAHPNVTHVDCLACHTGHRELREHMLREGIGVPAPPDDPAGGAP